jgi:hypothetical protein
MKRALDVMRLHMGCGEALTSRVTALRPAAIEPSPVRPRPVRRRPVRGKR